MPDWPLPHKHHRGKGPWAVKATHGQCCHCSSLRGGLVGFSAQREALRQRGSQRRAQGGSQYGRSQFQCRAPGWCHKSSTVLPPAGGEPGCAPVSAQPQPSWPAATSKVSQTRDWEVAPVTPGWDRGSAGSWPVPRLGCSGRPKSWMFSCFELTHSSQRLI